LSLLSRIPTASESAIAFVRRFFQLPLGMGVLWGIYYGLRVLRILNQRLPCLSQIERIIMGFFQKSVSASTGPLAIMSLDLFSHVVELMKLLNLPLDRRLRKRGQDYILQFQNQDGGFGTRKSSLKETAYAVRILKALDYPIHTLPAREFAFRCEQEEVGFTIVPGSTSAFLEDIYFGLLAFSTLGLKARYETAIASFIFECQASTYGFRRSRLLGISTLEYTYMAIKSLTMIGAIPREPDNRE
jgi:hypothetical protein